MSCSSRLLFFCINAGTCGGVNSDFHLLYVLHCPLQRQRAGAMNVGVYRRYSGVCYNDQCYNEQFLSIKSGCYNEHREILFIMEGSVIVFTKGRLFMLFKIYMYSV